MLTLERLEIEGFGPFADAQTLEFPPKGVTVFYGENMRGKTSLLNAIRYAFFGTVLNLNFLLAGTVSTNPVLFALATLLVLAWKVAGYWGLDRFLLPRLGVPWKEETTIALPATPVQT